MEESGCDLTGGTDENYEKLEDRTCPGRNSNRASLEYKSETFPFQPPYSVFWV
jgi:hypothetical protein